MTTLPVRPVAASGVRRSVLRVLDRAAAQLADRQHRAARQRLLRRSLPQR